MPLRSSTVVISTTTVAPIRTTVSPITASEKPKTTPRVVRRKLISRTPPLSRRTQEITTLPSTTTSSTTQSPEIYSNESLDEDVASILPALTSVKPRKTSISHDSDTKVISTIQPILYETSTLKPTTTFDQILQHQYKIKGLDKDYEDEKFERYENHQEEDEKLIGVLGSQVKYFNLNF